MVKGTITIEASPKVKRRAKGTTLTRIKHQMLTMGSAERTQHRRDLIADGMLGGPSLAKPWKERTDKKKNKPRREPKVKKVKKEETTNA